MLSHLEHSKIASSFSIRHRFLLHQSKTGEQFTHPQYLQLSLSLDKPNLPLNSTMVCNLASCRVGSQKTLCISPTRQATGVPSNPEVKIVPVSQIAHRIRETAANPYKDAWSEMSDMLGEWTRELGHSRAGMWLLWHELLNERYK